MPQQIKDLPYNSFYYQINSQSLEEFIYRNRACLIFAITRLYGCI